MAKVKKSPASQRRQSPLKLPSPKIDIYNTQKIVPLSNHVVKKMIQALLDHFELKPEGLAIHFVTKKKISELHLQFFNDPSPTDCITFPIDSTFLGEMFICPETAIDYTANKKIDLYEEISRYLVHCFLHLLGFDDQNVQSKRIMRQKENQFLKLFKEQGLTLRQ